MKKKSLILLSIPFLLLSGCKNDKKDGSTLKGPSKGQLTPELINKNCKIAEADEDYVADNGVIRKTSEQLTGYSIHDSSYLNAGGILVLKNEQEYLGFYNCLYNKFIIRCQYEPSCVSYNIIINQDVGCFIILTYGEDKYLYDSFGNLIYQYEENDLVRTPVTQWVNKKLYGSCGINSSNSFHFCYTENGIEKVNSIPNQLEETNEDYDIQQGGALYENSFKIDLKKYGHNGCYINNYGTLFTTFNSENKAVCSFNVFDSGACGIIGDYVLIQRSTQMSDEPESYTYEANKTKYSLETYKINYLTGKKEEVNLDYVIQGSITGLLNSNDVYKTAYADVAIIGENKTLEPTITSIIDENFKLIQDVTGEAIGSFTKLPNGYFYNRSTKILYGSDMKVVAFLADMAPTLDLNTGVSRGTKDGLKGAVDFTGKIKIPFEFTEFYSGLVGSCILGKSVKHGYCRYNCISKNYRSYGSAIAATGYSGFYYVSTGSNIESIITANEDLISNVNVSNDAFTGISLGIGGAGGIYLSSSNGVYQVKSYINKKLFVTDVKTVGVEKTEAFLAGDSKTNATPLKNNDDIYFYSKSLLNYQYFSYTNNSDVDVYVSLNNVSNYSTISSSNITPINFENKDLYKINPNSSFNFKLTLNSSSYKKYNLGTITEVDVKYLVNSAYFNFENEAYIKTFPYYSPSSTYDLSINVLKSGTLSFALSFMECASETVTIKHNNTKLKTLSNSITENESISVSAGDTVQIIYYVNFSNNSSPNYYCKVSNISLI